MTSNRYAGYFVVALLLGLAGCAVQPGQQLPTPGPNFVGFGFIIDPVAQTFSAFTPSSLQVSGLVPQDGPRPLVNGEEIDFSLDVAFGGNAITATIRFTNSTPGTSFHQPFSLDVDDSLTTATATVPAITDDLLSGDGILGPGETSGGIAIVFDNPPTQPFAFHFDLLAHDGPPAADLAVTKSDQVDPVDVGADVVYTVEVTNNGPDTAQDVVVSDMLPASVDFVSAAPGQGSCSSSGQEVTCNLGDIASGETVSVEIVATTTAAGTITNEASASSSTSDPDGLNNSASEQTTVEDSGPPPPGGADLSISKSDDPDPVMVGETLTYTVTVSNAGPDAAENVVVTDTLPAGVSLVETSGCAEDPNGVPGCSLGTIAAGGGAQYTIEVLVSPDISPTIQNTASVSSSTADPNSGNNDDSETTTVTN